MWVFGYGSLIWNPGFSYKESRVGFIRGYSRRFWQGNDYHRGCPKRIGRVATLVEDQEGSTWGRAFLLDEESESSISYLDTRETKLGGYSTTIVTFFPRDPNDTEKPVLLYVALPDSRLYVGPSPISEVATAIAHARGTCGHNAEYLLRLAEFMRDQVPEFWDEHLYHLEHLVRARLKERNISVDDVMDQNFMETKDSDTSTDEEGRGDTSPRRSTAFVSSLPSRKLRCVNL